MPFRGLSVRRVIPIALAASAPVLLAITFLAGSIPDDEEFRYSLVTSTLHLRALAEGRLGMWTSALGFGMPQPLSPNLDMHPLLPLLAVVSPATWARVLYVAHTVLGAFGMWHLGRALQLGPFVRAVCVLTLTLSAPTQNYALTDFWPSHYVLWTSAPWLLLMARRLLAATGREVRRWSVLLGVCGGLALASSHLGHAPVYGVVVLAVVATEWRAARIRWRWVTLAALIALALASPSLVQLATERAIFSADLELFKLSEPLPLSAGWDALLRPLSSSELTWQVDVVRRGTRTLFFGGPFALLALVGALLFWRSHRSLVFGAAMASVLLFTRLLPALSIHRFHFRDPLILCAVPLAGLAADQLLRLRRTRPLAILLMTAQVALMAAAVSPFLVTMWSRDARQALTFREATADAPFVDSLLALMPSGGRLAYSPQVDADVGGERLSEGLGTNALAFRGVSVVNGMFKGISTDVLWPDDGLFFGRIRLPQQLIESDEGLDVLGIRYVLANPGETIAPGLRVRASMPKRYGGTLLLYENPDAGPGGFVIPDPAQELPTPPRFPGCSNDRLLCRDLTGVARLRSPGNVAISREGGHVVVETTGASEPGLLVLTEMFRPEWIARAADRRLATRSVGPGLLGVVLPPGVTEVRLDYRPAILIAANVARWTALVGGLVTLLFLRVQ